MFYLEKAIMGQRTYVNPVDTVSTQHRDLTTRSSQRTNEQTRRGTRNQLKVEQSPSAASCS